MFSFDHILKNLKLQIKSGNTLIRLIAANVVVFIAIKLIWVISFLVQASTLNKWVADILSLPASLDYFITQPWSIITYMFLHTSFWHIFFNLLVLYWFGTLFVQYLSPRRLKHVYFLGGIAGGLLYMLAFNIFPVFANALPEALALGASAAVFAIMTAIATYQPNIIVRLFLFGSVKIKYIALVLIALDVFRIPEGNAGGHIAHIGGAAFGFLYIYLFRKGTDISNWGILNKGFSFKHKRKPKMKVHKNTKAQKPVSDEEYNRQKKIRQQKIDAILDKVSQKGYDSLTKEEKELLFKAGKN